MDKAKSLDTWVIELAQEYSDERQKLLKVLKTARAELEAFYDGATESEEAGKIIELAEAVSACAEIKIVEEPVEEDPRWTKIEEEFGDLRGS
jgi:hypothetical protein